jgi:tRNA-dihydrouridine synthase B
MSQFKYLLAPLENTSDKAFRKLCYNHGADLTFTEMTRLKSLIKNNKSTLKKIKLIDDTPTTIQLLVSSEKDVETFLKTFKPKKGFKGFNINLGCPSPDVINIGLGCAMIKRVSKIKKIVDIFKKYNYEISIKLRLGMNQYEKQKKAYLNLIKEINCDFIIHARHGKQTYEEKADFSIYKECVATGRKIFANGDITTHKQIEELKEIGVKGVMIGREAVRNPAIFEFLKNKKEPDFEKLKKEYVELTDTYQTPDVYKNNIIPRLGKEADRYRVNQG